MVVGRNGRDLRVCHGNLWIERREFPVLLVFLGTVVTSSEGEDHRIVALQLAEFALRVRVVRQLVIGKDGAGNHV